MMIGKKSLPTYPLLAALVPVLLYYNTQATQEVPLDGLIAPSAVAIAVTIIFYLLPCLAIHLIGRKNEKAEPLDLISFWALWTAIAWLIVYSPTFVIELNGFCQTFALPVDAFATATTAMPLFWLLLIGVALIPVIRRPMLMPLTRILEKVFALLFVLELAACAWFFVRSDLIIRPAVEAIQAEDVIKPATAGVAIKCDTSRRPDIYYIILDEMAGSGVLRKYLNYDDGWFRKALEERGFYVTSKSLSNYPLTRLSISSSLNMMYLDPYAGISGRNNADLTVTAFLIRNSALAKL